MAEIHSPKYSLLRVICGFISTGTPSTDMETMPAVSTGSRK
jgi:hypothetical protein